MGKSALDDRPGAGDLARRPIHDHSGAGAKARGTARALGLALIAGYLIYYLYLSLGISFPLLIDGVLDDSFYYLQVAKNVARGLGSTFDGVEPTNGYHPLWLLLLIPVYKLSGGALELPVRLALLLGALLAVGSLFWLRRVLRGAGGPWIAVAGLLLFAWPRFFGQTVNLLETSLLLFLYLCFIGAWLERGRSRAGSSLSLGLLLGLACLARLDTVFLLLSLGCFGVILAARGQSLWAPEGSVQQSEPPDPAGPRKPVDHREGRLALGWRNLRFLLPAVLLVAPYLIWNVVRFGHLQPVSGAMKSSFPRAGFHPGYLLDFPDFTLLLIIGAFLALRAARSTASPFIRVLGIFGLAALFHMTYTLLFMCWGVDRWHYGLLIPIGLLGIPYLGGRAAERTGLSGRLRPGGRLALAAFGLVLTAGLQTYSVHLRHGRYLDATRRVALWAGANLPSRSVVAMTDAGVFGYFSGLTTVNLDGLINSFRYLEMLREGRLADYLRERGVGYVLDQYMVGRPDLVSGDYDSRILHIWYRPENRVGGEITLRRSDEVYRVQLRVRPSIASPSLRPNAIVLWKLRT